MSMPRRLRPARSMAAARSCSAGRSSFDRRSIEVAKERSGPRRTVPSSPVNSSTSSSGSSRGRHVVDLFDLGCHVVGSCACGERAKWRRGGVFVRRESAGERARRAAVDDATQLMCLPLLLARAGAPRRSSMAQSLPAARATPHVRSFPIDSLWEAFGERLPLLHRVGGHFPFVGSVKHGGEQWTLRRRVRSGLRLRRRNARRRSFVHRARTWRAPRGAPSRGRCAPRRICPGRRRAARALGAQFGKTRFRWPRLHALEDGGVRDDDEAGLDAGEALARRARMNAERVPFSSPEKAPRHSLAQSVGGSSSAAVFRRGRRPVVRVGGTSRDGCTGDGAAARARDPESAREAPR